MAKKTSPIQSESHTAKRQAKALGGPSFTDHTAIKAAITLFLAHRTNGESGTSHGRSYRTQAP